MLPTLNQYLLIFFSAAIVNNVLLNRILGLCPFMGVSTKVETALGMGMATAFVLTIASGLGFWMNKLLVALDLTYLTIITFIILIASTVQLIEIIMRKTSPLLYQVLGIYLPLITTNCAVLGIPLISLREGHNFTQALVFGFSSAFGFALVLLLFATIREKLNGANIPKYFSGAPIALVTASLMSLACLGLNGLVR